MPTLILASTSRYKKSLLERLGLPFETLAPAVDEQQLAQEHPPAMARRLARAKAQATKDALQHLQGPQRLEDTVIIGADQVAARDDHVLRKPGGHAEALRQLVGCQGQTVSFHTAVTVLDPDGNRHEHTDRTDVDFATLDTAQLERYLQLEAPYDCAGSFKAEGLGIALFSAIRSHDPTALIGLPLIWLAHTLRTMGCDPLSTS